MGGLDRGCIHVSAEEQSCLELVEGVYKVRWSGT